MTGTCVMFDMPEFVSTVDESVVGEGNADSLTLRERVSILPYTAGVVQTTSLHGGRRLRLLWCDVRASDTRSTSPSRGVSL